MIELPELPYAPSALEPLMSARTLKFHHGKHHRKYVDTTNSLIEGTRLAKASLEDIIRKSHGKDTKLFNNAAQTYNHNLFWQSMTPKSSGRIPAGLKKKIVDAFGAVDDFRKAFVKAGTGQFGSGWVWLVSRAGALEIMATANAETPLTDGAEPLLVCDVWEHAYYLDYQNKRGDFLKAFINDLVNWDLAAERYAAP